MGRGVWLLVLGLAVAVFAGVQVSNGALYFFNETSDLRGSVYLKVFDLARWWDLNYSSVLVRASVGAEWRFERVEGALLDYALFWEDCSRCDSDSPPPVKNRDTLYEDLILRVTYVGGRWVVGVLWGQGGFGHEVYVNGSLLYRKPPGYAGEPGVWGEYVGVALEVRLVSLGDSRADAAALFTAFDWAHEALACAAALGLDAKETNGLLRHFGVSEEVVRVRRGDGGAAFVFRNGSVVSVPLVLDVDVGQWGRFVLVNPCGAAVNWTLRLYVDNKTLGSKPGGRLAAEVPADMAPYSVAPVYVFGVAEKAGMYRVSYRLYVRLGVYDVWGYRVEVNKERLAAANGSFANWVWGFVESLAGRAAGDRCAEARGAGRMWAAERIGWAGVVAEVDTALGGAALFFSAGTYGAGRTAAKGAAEAVKVAGEVARGYKAARAVTYAYQLWQGVLLGWDVYFSVARGEVPVEALGAAVASVGGRVGERVRLVYNLAAGGLLLMNLGHVPEMEELVRSIHDEASKYGEYAYCFVDGALGAFDVYAKEVLANQLVGVFSIFLDIDKVLNNKAYKGYLQLAGHSAFDYERPVPVITKNKLKNVVKNIFKNIDAVWINKRIIGIDHEGSIKQMRGRIESNKIKPRTETLTLDKDRKCVVHKSGDVEVSLTVGESEDSTFIISVAKVGDRVVVLGYNDMFTALSFARGVDGSLYRVGSTFIMIYNLNPGLFNVVGKEEAIYKYVSTAVLPRLEPLNLKPWALGAEVTLPVVKSGTKYLLTKGSGVYQSDFGARTLFISLEAKGLRFDILGISNDGRLVIGEVKNMKSVYGPSELELEEMADRVEMLYALLRGDVYLGDRRISAEEGAALVGALVSVFNGGRLSGGGRVSSSFSAEPVVLIPDYRKETKFVLVLADREFAAVFIYEVPLAQLLDRGFLRRVAEETYRFLS
ncbi:MAG: hypothetical protein ACO2PM_01870 [Pyrobaculum sp.]